VKPAAAEVEELPWLGTINPAPAKPALPPPVRPRLKPTVDDNGWAIRPLGGP
jgi:hypothetical protein